MAIGLAACTVREIPSRLKERNNRPKFLIIDETTPVFCSFICQIRKGKPRSPFSSRMDVTTLVARLTYRLELGRDDRRESRTQEVCIGQDCPWRSIVGKD